MLRKGETSHNFEPSKASLIIFEAADTRTQLRTSGQNVVVLITGRQPDSFKKMVLAKKDDDNNNDGGTKKGRFH